MLLVINNKTIIIFISVDRKCGEVSSKKRKMKALFSSVMVAMKHKKHKAEHVVQTSCHHGNQTSRHHGNHISSLRSNVWGDWCRSTKLNEESENISWDLERGLQCLDNGWLWYCQIIKNWLQPMVWRGVTKERRDSIVSIWCDSVLLI